MINAQMKPYPYWRYEEENEYGEKSISFETNPLGEIKMSINLINQQTVDNILYQDANYIGLTLANGIDDSYIFQYGDDEKLKVVFVNPIGRYKQVYLVRM